MNRISRKTILCAALAFVASALSAQDQQFTPAVGATTTLTSDATSSIMVKVDGSRVIDASGQPLGRIENIVLSPVGCAEAAILTATSGRLIPIPWTLVRVSGDTRAAGAMPGANMVFSVNVDQARLAQAPSFTRSQWPDMSNQNWLQTSINFFGSATAVGAAGGGTNTVTGAAGSINATAPPSTATGGTQQDRFGTTATRTPTNSGTLLPPTGRTNSARPGFETPATPPQTPGIPPGPPDNRPPENRPPDNRPPAGTPPPTRPPGSVPPASPSTQP